MILWKGTRFYRVKLYRRYIFLRETHSHKKISVTIESVDFEMSCHAVMVSG